MQMFFMTVHCKQLSLSCFKALFTCFLLHLGCLCCTSLFWLAKVSLVKCFANTGGAGLKDLLWSLVPMAVGETSYGVRILARAEAELNADVVDNFQLALSW